MMNKYNLAIYEEIVEEPRDVVFKTKKGKKVSLQGFTGVRTCLVELPSVIKELKKIKTYDDLKIFTTYLEKKFDELEEKYDLGLLEGDYEN